ncbi:hypothetical protein MBLNU459_g0184t1 [Dothideomycetes sp. NU459]
MHTAAILTLVAFTGWAHAHFILNYPNSLGFDDDNEPNGPCGGFDVTFADNDTTVQVGGFAVSLKSTHPAANFLFRATLSTQAPFNWTNLLPVVSETGLGQFCLPDLAAPSEFAGQRGLVQIIQDGPDGVLYQCAAVNFATGMNTTVGSGCTNATGLTASITNMQTFSNANISDSSDSGSSMSGTMSMTGTESASSAGASSSSATGKSSSSKAGAVPMVTPAVQAVVMGLGALALL